MNYRKCEPSYRQIQEQIAEINEKLASYDHQVLRLEEGILEIKENMYDIKKLIDNPNTQKKDELRQQMQTLQRKLTHKETIHRNVRAECDDLRRELDFATKLSAEIMQNVNNNR